MNREIKFRVWYKSKYRPNTKGEMTYIDDWYWYEESGISDFKDFEREGYTLMQYTGLKDKDGKEIYEGDIYKLHGWLDLQNRDILYTPEYIDGTYFNRRLTLDYEKFIKFNVDVDKSIQHDMKTHKKYIEVIGNIYENPELLQSGT